MKTKMVVTLPNKHTDVFEFEIDYIFFEIKDGTLFIYKDVGVVKKVYARGFWKTIDFNHG
jgi:hypothetical protein